MSRYADAAAASSPRCSLASDPCPKWGAQGDRPESRRAMSSGVGPQAVSDGQTILAILCSHSRKYTAADRLLRHVYTGTFNLVGWYT